MANSRVRQIKPEHLEKAFLERFIDCWYGPYVSSTSDVGRRLGITTDETGHVAKLLARRGVMLLPRNNLGPGKLGTDIDWRALRERAEALAKKMGDGE